MDYSKVLYELYAVIMDRKTNPKEGSYTNYLFDKGIDKILKKKKLKIENVLVATMDEDSNFIFQLKDEVKKK